MRQNHQDQWHQWPRKRATPEIVATTTDWQSSVRQTRTSSWNNVIKWEDYEFIITSGQTKLLAIWKFKMQGFEMSSFWSESHWPSQEQQKKIEGLEQEVAKLKASLEGAQADTVSLQGKLVNAQARTDLVYRWHMKFMKHQRTTVSSFLQVALSQWQSERKKEEQEQRSELKDACFSTLHIQACAMVLPCRIYDGSWKKRSRRSEGKTKRTKRQG